MLPFVANGPTVSAKGLRFVKNAPRFIAQESKDPANKSAVAANVPSTLVDAVRTLACGLRFHDVAPSGLAYRLPVYPWLHPGLLHCRAFGPHCGRLFGCWRRIGLVGRSASAFLAFLKLADALDKLVLLISLANRVRIIS